MERGCEVSYVTVHGHRRAYVMKPGPRSSDGQDAPVLLLLHGLAGDHHDWDPVLDALARRYTVIAPDFLGHGDSDKPRADYSLGGYANGMRDLLTILGIDKVTVVGHSFGGGVAMQFAYQFPERTERIVLVSSGGLGNEVSAAIRAITLPGFHETIGFLNLPGIRHLMQGTLRGAARVGNRLDGPAWLDLIQIAEIMEVWRDPAARRAIKHVVRNVVDIDGQIVTMRDRAYLTESMPLCVIWGSKDPVIPVAHAQVIAELAPTATVKVIEGAGHFPHHTDPKHFVKILEDFVKSSEPAVYKRSRWRQLLAHGAQNTDANGKRKVAKVVSIKSASSA